MHSQRQYRGVHQQERISMVPNIQWVFLSLVGFLVIHSNNAFGNTQQKPLSSEQVASYFSSEYAPLVPDLSATSIVEMMPKHSSTGPLRQELFQTPLISSLYERVLLPLWELGLRVGGPDAEYQAAAPQLGTGGVALDLSCGTGFVGSRMAHSNKFGVVFGLDYSRPMLQECVASVKRSSQSSRTTRLGWIRGTANALPFRDNVLDAVHWGAAMHCVPNAERALQEIYRVLKPGGRLYATTFLRPFPDVVFRFFTVEEIEILAANAGFVNEKTGGSNQSSRLRVEARGVYGILYATK